MINRTCKDTLCPTQSPSSTTPSNNWRTEVHRYFWPPSRLVKYSKACFQNVSNKYSENSRVPCSNSNSNSNSKIFQHPRSTIFRNQVIAGQCLIMPQMSPGGTLFLSYFEWWYHITITTTKIPHRILDSAGAHRTCATTYCCVRILFRGPLLRTFESISCILLYNKLKHTPPAVRSKISSKLIFLQTACDIPIARIALCVVKELVGYSSVWPLARGYYPIAYPN